MNWTVELLRLLSPSLVACHFLWSIALRRFVEDRAQDSPLRNSVASFDVETSESRLGSSYRSLYLHGFTGQESSVKDPRLRAGESMVRFVSQWKEMFGSDNCTHSPSSTFSPLLTRMSRTFAGIGVA